MPYRASLVRQGVSGPEFDQGCHRREQHREDPGRLDLDLGCTLDGRLLVVADPEPVILSPRRICYPPSFLLPGEGDRV